MDQCIFCQIAQQKIPCKKVHENEEFLAFYDISPKARVHVLVIPRHHIASFHHLEEKDAAWAGRYMVFITQVAKVLNLDHYKVAFNSGRGSGQEVFHLHAHLLQH